ncbi:hybrid nucleoside-diphosphate sugar epimerase/sugar transferase [Deinococcus koreensis]|uniref:Sugar transferase n=1 Tax=Deinococcus koreensis TaxID=2054903 RepID=A0A2K3UTM7_9DEIO|nr:hybrid nucleoside-diphosphate sugar epimerase/sugar transferase [Deinococcus koreensis]PNY79889.1 sugar transferase [Deinococcus koreensis]
MSGRVLVVGASGFVGQVVVLELLSRGKLVLAAARQRSAVPPGAAYVTLPDLTQTVEDWSEMLLDVDQIVYLAARVHVMNDTHPDPLAAYRAVNRDAALSLAAAAARQGVRRFVYLSSVKVNGESSDRPLTEDDLPRPSDPYGQSKWEAEQALLRLGQDTGLGVVILRPPLVYGPGVKANFMALARAAGRGFPLPIGAIKNRRSMVYVGNLADLIAVALEHPAAPGEMFFASDGQDLSTPELTRFLAETQGRHARLPAIPVPLLLWVGRITGRGAVIRRLTGSLQVSSAKAQRLLSWTPPYPVWQAMARTGQSLDRDRPSQRTEPSRYTLSASQRRYLLVRSLLERILALLALIVLAPLLLGLAALIRLDSPGHPLFIQERAGQGHRPFRIFKFRTMQVGTPHLSTEDMQRTGVSPVTRLGAVLRRTSLDELPQLLNVLRGEMSLVGPRPALMTQTPVLRLREQTGVDALLPGVTGYAQATGRDDLDDVEKVRRDAQYMRTLGFRRDFEIIQLTLLSVFKGTGNK